MTKPLNIAYLTLIVSLTLTLAALGATPVHADSAWVTQADVLDAILERRSFTPQERAEIDLNGDGVVDVADLVCLRFQCHREASFATSATTVDEGAGTVPITIQLETAYSGNLTYSVSGTATAGADYDALSGIVAIDGTSATVLVPIVDDAERSEDGETIVLTLGEASGYGLGPIAEHTILVVDNDALWQGALLTTGGVVRFRLAIGHTDAGYSVALEGDPHGGFPEGSWPATATIDTPAETFVVDVAPIPLDPEATSFGVDFLRRLELNPADMGADPEVLTVTDTFVFGEFRETLSCPSRPELTRVDTGRFSLARVETSGTQVEATLTASSQGE